MRALIIDPGKAPEITTQLPNDEQGIARWLGGPVRMQPFGQYPAALLYTASAGQDVPNRHYIDRWYYGRLVIVGYDRQHGSICRLSKEDESVLTGKWMGVEAEQ